MPHGWHTLSASLRPDSAAGVASKRWPGLQGTFDPMQLMVDYFLPSSDLIAEHWRFIAG
jgi:hypothetical protein